MLPVCCIVIGELKRPVREGGLVLDVYSTANVPSHTRASYWNDVYSRRFAQVTFNPVDREGFEAELRMGVVGPLAIARVYSEPTHIERNKAHIERSGGRLFSFMLQARGCGVFSHYGHETVIEEGDFTLCDNSVPHRFDLEARAELIILRVAPEVLRNYMPCPERVCGLRLRSGEGLAGTAANMAQNLWSLLESGLPEKFSSMVARNVLDIMASAYAIAFDSELADTATVGARKVRALRYIEAHLKDPDLTPCSVADALHISPRYLRMLFSGEKETVSNYILRRRLEECAKLISNPLWRGHTITEIAFGWGFNSAAHFTRAFRDQFGVTPSEYRRTKLGHNTTSIESTKLSLT